MVVFAFARFCAALRRDADVALDFGVVVVVNQGVIAGDFDAVTIFEETDFFGERSESVGVGGYKRWRAVCLGAYRS